MKINHLLPIILFFLSFAIAKGEELCKGYMWYVDFALGDAYNINTAQRISSNNMQLYSMITTTHGYVYKKWFIGGGVGYYHSFRDGENMYPVFASGRYISRNFKNKPYLESRAGIIYDPLWVRKVQAYGAFSAGMNIYKRLQIGIKLSIFSRPSRYFTANAAVVFSYAIGK